MYYALITQENDQNRIKAHVIIITIDICISRRAHFNVSENEHRSQQNNMEIQKIQKDYNSIMIFHS